MSTIQTPDPREEQIAAVWDAAMNDGNGRAAVGALARALREADTTRPGAVQDAAIGFLLAPDADPGPVWLAVASNAFGSMLREARRIATKTEATA